MLWFGWRGEGGNTTTNEVPRNDMFNSIESKQPNHLDNGFDVTCTQAGQRRRYGDSYYEYTVKSEKPESEVKQYCTETIHKCDLTTSEYLANERAGVKDFGDHFRKNYKFKKVKEGEYFYQVTSPSTH